MSEGVNNPSSAMAEINYLEVNTHFDLPPASENTGEVYLVRVSTGVFGVDRKRAGLWRSDGFDWYRLGALTGSGGVIYSTPPNGKKRVNNVYFDPELGKYTFEREE